MNKNTPTDKQCRETLRCLIDPIICVFKRPYAVIADINCEDAGCCCNCNKDCIVDDNEQFVSFVRKLNYKKIMK